MHIICFDWFVCVKACLLIDYLFVGDGLLFGWVWLVWFGCGWLLWVSYVVSCLGFGLILDMVLFCFVFDWCSMCLILLFFLWWCFFSYVSFGYFFDKGWLAVFVLLLLVMVALCLLLWLFVGCFCLICGFTVRLIWFVFLVWFLLCVLALFHLRVSVVDLLEWLCFCLFSWVICFSLFWVYIWLNWVCSFFGMGFGLNCLCLFIYFGFRVVYYYFGLIVFFAL